MNYDKKVSEVLDLKGKVDETLLLAAAYLRQREKCGKVADELFQSGGLFAHGLTIGDDCVIDGFLLMAKFCKRHKAQFIAEMCI